jgi:hypothetical protein
MNSRESECQAVGFATTMLTCWKAPFGKLVDPLLRVADSGFRRGDVVYGTYCLSQCYCMHVGMGTNVESLTAAMQMSYLKVSELRQVAQLFWLQPVLQYALNMQSDVCSWENIATLSGKITDKDI